MKGKNNSLPQSAPEETVRAFNKDNDGCPTVGDLSVDWSDSLKKSPWNTEVVNLLAVDFQMKVKSGIYSKVVFNDETMSLDNLRLLCIDKLRRTQTMYRLRARLSTYSNLEDMDHASHEMLARNERRQRLDRSNTRKHGVGSVPITASNHSISFVDAPETSKNSRTKSPSKSRNLGHDHACH